MLFSEKRRPAPEAILFGNILLCLALATLGAAPPATPTPAPSQTVDVSLDFQNGKLVVTATPDVVHLSVKKGEHVEWEVSPTSPIKDFDFSIEMNDQALPSAKRMARPSHVAKGKSRSQAAKKGQESTHHQYTIYVGTGLGSAAADPEVTIDP
jgi:hypothetical protein